MYLNIIVFIYCPTPGAICILIYALLICQGKCHCVLFSVFSGQDLFAKLQNCWLKNSSWKENFFTF